jgi:hypothetical protein
VCEAAAARRQIGAWAASVGIGWRGKEEWSAPLEAAKETEVVEPTAPSAVSSETTPPVDGATVAGSVLGPSGKAGPTITLVGKMKNLVAALNEINRETSLAGGFPFVTYVRPWEYARWDPRQFEAQGVLPMIWIQEGFSYYWAYEPDDTRDMQIKGRTVQVGTIGNRITERAIVRKLAPALDPLFSRSACAYRRGRSTQTAVLEARDRVRAGFHFAVKADVKNFFPSIDRKRLEEILRDIVSDEPLCEMILRSNSPIDHLKISPWVALHERAVGLPQGNSLSPVLSNVYMNGFDHECVGLNYWRYADDILILCRSFEEASKALEFVARRLSALGLALNSDKTTPVVNLRKTPITFLGYEMRGGNLYPPEKAVQRLREALKVRGKHARIDLMRSFVDRYRIGKVRKLFRRIDRECRGYYPAGWSLVGILDGRNNTERYKVFGIPKGKAAGQTAKKAPCGQSPVAVAAGEQGTAGPAPSPRWMELTMKKLMRSPVYLEFIRNRVCSFCPSVAVEPHHAIRYFTGIGCGGVGLKGSDFLTVPACRACHLKIHARTLTPTRSQLMEIVIRNLVCFSADLSEQFEREKILRMA